MRAILLGLLSSTLFSATFIINRAMNVSGTSWAWTASFRFYLLFLFYSLSFYFAKTLGIMGRVKNIHWHGSDGVLLPVLVLFFIKFLSCLFSSWLVAGTWQVTILAGLLLSPLFS